MRRFVLLLTLFVPLLSVAQSDFTTAAYEQFLKDNADLSAAEIISRYSPEKPFYNSRTEALNINDYAFLDSIQIKYGLTADELAMLKDNHFVVSERLTYDCFGEALHNIYQQDLPVMVTSDAILYALHFSYDRILFDIERTLLEAKLRQVLDRLYAAFPQLKNKYAAQANLVAPLQDVDIYVSMAKSLLDEKLAAPQFAEFNTLEALWDAIAAEQMTAMPLFCERNRLLDFSQFTVRGHYTNEFWDVNGKRTLGNYFKAMMWLGRMDFYLTPPPDEIPWRPAEIQRMMAGSLLLNELLDTAGARGTLNEIDAIITFMVGESDNLTPTELADVVAAQGITPAAVFDKTNYETLQAELLSEVAYGQRIMSAIFIVDPFSSQPDALPISFRLCGQRFIIDSYVLANVVYDRIIYQNQKIWRPMPDPLDAMFVLGNDNALPLLQGSLEEFKYASQLEALRYLVDAYDQDFWQSSLYNVWLSGIRALNPAQLSARAPYFMQTVAWQQQKLNTQLASWTQLRHDNLLYAKQSYTGGTSCSYPHSYVEPYPNLYRAIATFAEKAQAQLLPLLGSGWESDLLKQYFPKLADVMLKLETLAEKELSGLPFDDSEKEWLQKMLFIDGMSGAPPFSGWYADLFYRLEQTEFGKYEGHDFLVADVHTQPTDEVGNFVGRVLHVGVGKVNLGIFLADAPSLNHQPMAYVGAVMSYYEKITDNFKRLTDEDWANLVVANDLPKRSDWVNVYLADAQGQARVAGRELPGRPYTQTVVDDSPKTPAEFGLAQNYPNPFNPSTVLEYNIAQQSHTRLAVYNSLGKLVAVLVDAQQSPGNYKVEWNGSDFPSGLYFAKLNAGGQVKTVKMMLIK